MFEHKTNIIERFTLRKYIGFSSHEELLSFVKDNCNDLIPNTTSNAEYKAFYDEYVNNGSKLKDIPRLRNISYWTCLAFAEDIAGTISGRREKIQNERNQNNELSKDENDDNSRFDIYKYAEENPNADYYDFHTGRIYHITEYMRAKKFGMPTFGIRVSENGLDIGYAQKL